MALPVLKEVPLRVIRGTGHEENMAGKRPTGIPSTQDEPIGIVISRGLRDEPAPVVRAYVWGPAPELDASETKAA